MNGLDWGFPAALAPPGPCEGEINAGRVCVCLCSIPGPGIPAGSRGCPGLWDGLGFGPGVTSANCGVKDGSGHQKSGEMEINPLCSAERVKVGMGHPSAHRVHSKPRGCFPPSCNFTFFCPPCRSQPVHSKPRGWFASFFAIFPLSGTSKRSFPSALALPLP